jgi:hypothetical protein
MEVMNQIMVHHIHKWKCNNETPIQVLCTNKNVFFLKGRTRMIDNLLMTRD